MERRLPTAEETDQQVHRLLHFPRSRRATVTIDKFEYDAIVRFERAFTGYMEACAKEDFNDPECDEWFEKCVMAHDEIEGYRKHKLTS